ncbi:MAG: gliding motility-associated C-terminal domain-containing protein [Bacteroidia bacterium]
MKNKFIFSLYVSILLPFFFTEGWAQNLFKNPGFESYSQCPNYTSQIDRCTDWDSAVGTADFYHCGYYANSTLGNYGIPKSGDGVIGFVCAPPSVWSPGTLWYGEVAKSTLIQTMIPGATYQIESNWVIPTTNLPAPTNNCYSIGFYFYKSIHPPYAPTRGCGNYKPQIIIDPSTVSVSNYTSYTHTFIADSCYDAVFVGIFCNDSTETPSCLQNADYEYFDVDDIRLTKISDAPIYYSGFTASDRIICADDCISFQDTSDVTRYSRTWYFENGTPGISTDKNPSSVCYDAPGDYDVTLVTVFECGSDSIVKDDYIHVDEIPTVEISADTSIVCVGQEKIITATGVEPFYWSTGEMGTSIIVKQTGIYFASASNTCGVAGDTIGIDYEKCPCNVWIPNAFSPNTDTKNENYSIVSDCILEEFNLRIYNRWGQEVFVTNDITQFWDGLYKNSLAPEGIYVAKINYKGYADGRLKDEQVVRTIMLLR